MRVRESVVAAVLVAAGCAGDGSTKSAREATTNEPSATAGQPTSTVTTLGPGGTTIAPSNTTIRPGDTSAVSPTSSAAVASAIAAAGIGCTDFIRQEPSQEEPEPKPTEGGQCTVGGVTLKINGYASAAAVQTVIAGKTAGCGYGRQRMMQERAVVVAGTQVLELADGNADVLNRLRSVVGGEVRMLRC